MGIPWQKGNGWCVFVALSCLLILSFLKVREIVLMLFLKTWKYANGCWIGILFTFVGLQGGIIVSSKSSLVELGSLDCPYNLITARLAELYLLIRFDVRGR